MTITKTNDNEYEKGRRLFPFRFQGLQVPDIPPLKMKGDVSVFV